MLKSRYFFILIEFRASYAITNISWILLSFKNLNCSKDIDFDIIGLTLEAMMFAII
jgi:hypothetical protein